MPIAYAQTDYTPADSTQTAYTPTARKTIDYTQLATHSTYWTPTDCTPNRLHTNLYTKPTTQKTMDATDFTPNDFASTPRCTIQSVVSPSPG